jgi:hypothetical protein
MHGLNGEEKKVNDLLLKIKITDDNKMEYEGININFKKKFLE